MAGPNPSWGRTLFLAGDGLVVESAGDQVTLGPRDLVLLEPGDSVRAAPSGLLVTIAPR